MASEEYKLKERKRVAEYRKINKEQITAKRRAKSKNNKQKLVDYKGGKCSVCGYNKHLSALDFHHINPDNKEFDIGKKLCISYDFKKLIEEADKCILICANCHRELHSLY